MSRPPLLLAVSGGRDSVVLLHLYRFTLPNRYPIAVLHVDHGMREGSRGDALWVQGLGRAWGVPVRTERLEPPPGSEAEARTRRYAALADEARRLGVSRVLVAHHAGDQAETVLFRLLRGTGPRGLSGIPPSRSLVPGVRLDRPLLHLPPSCLEAYARAHHLRWREDPTNRDRGLARNRIRHDLLPRLEAAAPGITRTLRGLAREAAGREAALSGILAPVLADLLAPHGSHGPGSEGGGGRVVARDRLLLYPRSVRLEVYRSILRALARRVGSRGLDLLDGFLVGGSTPGSLTPGPGVQVDRSRLRAVFRAV